MAKSTPSWQRHVPSFGALLAASAVLRIGLILYSDWHDARSVVKYTDVDYRVFSDATRFLVQPNTEAGNVAIGPLTKQLDLHIGKWVVSWADDGSVFKPPFQSIHS